MEIKFSTGGVTPFVSASRRDAAPDALPLPVNTTMNMAGAGEVSETSDSLKVQESVDDLDITQDKETEREMMERTSELVSMMSRDLKFEVHDEAGLVQIHVIDTTDGRIVRKIPADEVLRLMTAIKEKMTERLDVKA